MESEINFPECLGCYILGGEVSHLRNLADSVFSSFARLLLDFAGGRNENFEGQEG